MEQYTIYCTPEQTKKALILRAPIEHWGNTSNLIPPTAEQMIGWLEERGVYIHTEAVAGWWHYYVTNSVEYIKWETANMSRKEATLAAIDAALDYLIIPNSGELKNEEKK